MFSISKSIMTPAKMMPCTPELLNAAMDDAKVAETCQQIASHLEEVKNGTLAREAFNKIFAEELAAAAEEQKTAEEATTA